LTILLTNILVNSTAGENAVNEYLGEGKIFTSIYYLNSIGSINVIEEINSKARDLSIEAEASPTGFWALNCAAFVVQRRDDWAVSVKGFNNYVWDFDSASSNNVYGLYQSHGALLVANSEAALQISINCVPKLVWDFPRLCGLDTLIKFIIIIMISKMAGTGHDIRVLQRSNWKLNS